jgi:hypothetical protein
LHRLEDVGRLDLHNLSPVRVADRRGRYHTCEKGHARVR